MANCCGAARCTCRITAGPGITVEGNGSAGAPYVISGENALTAVEAVDTPTVDTTVAGTGVAGDPYVISAAVILDPAPPAGGSNLIQAGPDGLYLECAQVRPCLSAGDGIAYDPDTGVIAARPSTDPDNLVGFGTDGGLYATAPAAEPTVVEAGTGTTVTGTGTAADPYTVSATPPETGCGLTGDGSAGAPLAVATPAWPYPCTPEANGTAVVCDANGELRGAPEHSTYFEQFTEMRDYADLPVPAGFDVVADTFTWSYTNPDPCRAVTVFLEREADVDFDLPPGAAAAAGQDTDEMNYLRNTGTSTIFDYHVHGTKVYRHQVSLAPGATANVSFPVSIGRGSGGATYNRIQIFLRAMMHTI